MITQVQDTQYFFENSFNMNIFETYWKFSLWIFRSRISSSENKLRSMKQHKENEEKRLETLRNQLEITKSELETIPVGFSFEYEKVRRV